MTSQPRSPAASASSRSRAMVRATAASKAARSLPAVPGCLAGSSPSARSADAGMCRMPMASPGDATTAGIARSAVRLAPLATGFDANIDMSSPATVCSRGACGVLTDGPGASHGAGAARFRAFFVAAVVRSEEGRTSSEARPFLERLPVTAAGPWSCPGALPGGVSAPSGNAAAGPSSKSRRTKSTSADSASSASIPSARKWMVDCAPAFSFITRAVLRARTQSPSSPARISMCASKPAASWASFTAGRACSPVGLVTTTRTSDLISHPRPPRTRR